MTLIFINQGVFYETELFTLIQFFLNMKNLMTSIKYGFYLFGFRDILQSNELTNVKKY